MAAIPRRAALLGLLAFGGARGPSVRAQSAHPAEGATGPGLEPFRATIPDGVLAGIREQVAAHRWPASALAPDGDWRHGVPSDALRRLAARWAGGYDWRAREREIDRFDQFRVNVAGERMHFALGRGSGAGGRLPVLLLHGWPYSFASLLPLAERLAHPERFGGRTEDGVDVVVPSLPGYGFSDRPAAPLGPREMGRRMHLLMTEALGRPRYLVHGGDVGAHAASWMGFDYPEAVAAVHTTFPVLRQSGAGQGSGETGPGPSTQAERDYVTAERAAMPERFGYAAVQMTQPQALAPAMLDSPVGAAAWIVQRYHDWADLRERRFEDAFTADQLLDEVMLYVATDRFDSALWFYAGYRDQEPKTLPPGGRVSVPTWVAAFPDPLMPPPPRELVERSHDVAHWTAMPRGGHFPFYEAPDLLARDLELFVRENAGS